MFHLGQQEWTQVCNSTGTTLHFLCYSHTDVKQSVTRCALSSPKWRRRYLKRWAEAWIWPALRYDTHSQLSSHLIVPRQRPNFLVANQPCIQKTPDINQMNISCFLGVWFPIWLRPDNSDIAVTHSLRSPACIPPNQISLLGLFIIASSDCEWCLANGFSIQICCLDATESQQGLSYHGGGRCGVA